MKDSIDFIKLGYLAVINLNNMIPVSSDQIEYFDIDSEKDEKYRDLLRNEYIICQRKEDIIINNARRLYKKVTVFNSFISKRCCNFKLLEQKSLEYEEMFSNVKAYVAASKEHD